MQFKRTLLASALASAALLGLTACDGEDGIAGAAGTAGADGLDGAGQVIALARIGRSNSQGFDVSGAEIVDFHAGSDRIFTVNANSGTVDVFNATDVTTLAAPAQSIDVKQMLVDNGDAASTTVVGNANSVSVNGNLVAVAIEANPKTDNGWVLFLNATTLAYVDAVAVGALPDMVTFTPDGSKAIVANEGEPNEGYSIDPEGSVSVINTSTFAVTNIGFSAFNAGGARNGELPMTKMLVGGINASVAQSLEPEYITVRADGAEAYVSLQENNAIAVINLSSNAITKIIGLGFKNHALPGNELDASQRDGVNLRNWPVMGIYMPDSMTSFSYAGRTYLLTANEGDSREDWLNPLADGTACTTSGYYFDGGECKDELELRNITDSDFTAGTALAGLDTDSTLGRLRMSYHATKIMNGGTTINTVYAYGARSFSIWDAATGEQVFDSANDFERITAQRYGALFNQDHNGTSVTGDRRSNSKGPEPEAIAVGRINGHTYAFVGLERMGGIMVYDVSNPFAPSFVQYINDRDVTVAPDAAAVAAGMDLGPESIRFVNASDSPNGKPLLIVGSEVSGTTSVYEVRITDLRE
jgi:DNA-binding beta-propeller fold protein YncE